MEIECIYTKGVLKPLKKLKLKEGQKVKIKLEGKEKVRGVPLSKTLKAYVEENIILENEEKVFEKIREKARKRNVHKIINEAFGILKGKNTEKALIELENEWGLC